MKTTNMITMKTFYILAAFLGLQFNTIFAASNFNETTILSKEIVIGITNAMLMPATPAEATFEDIAEASVNNGALTPALPMFADFSDEAPALETRPVNLAPVTPKEADFEDGTEPTCPSTARELAPVTPADADFEDHV
jgi:hypothetical protein